MKGGGIGVGGRGGIRGGAVEEVQQAELLEDQGLLLEVLGVNRGNNRIKFEWQRRQLV